MSIRCNKNRLEDHFSSKVFDNVYGFIFLTDQEKKLLSTPYFQRIGQIKQLALADFVFPGAVHTRLSHSLGVLHITEKLIQQFKKYYKLDKKTHQIFRLAALLHDIGHYPLSHTIETAYFDFDTFEKDYNNFIQDNKDPNYFLENYSTYEKNSNNSRLYKTLLPDNTVSKFLEYDKKNVESEYHHENLGAEIILKTELGQILIQLFEEVENDSDLRKIGYLIKGKLYDLNKSIPVTEDFFHLSRFINSKFDADQIDYMIRDTFNTGIKTSLDIDFIISNLELLNKNYKKGPKETICYNNKALQAIEQFILAKYYWYSSIIYYDKVYIMNFIARRIYSYLLVNAKFNEVNEQFKPLTFSKIIDLANKPNEFAFFNDNYFWNLLRLIVKKEIKVSDIVYRLSCALINKDFPAIINERTFNQIFSLGNYNYISYNGCLSQEGKKLTEERELFREEVKKLPNYLPVSIDRAIFDNDFKNKKNVVFQNDKCINISCDNGNCLCLEDLPNQIMDKFVFKTGNLIDSSKLYLFKVYNFEEIVNNPKYT